MANEKPNSNEEEIRRQIRAEIEQRDRQKEAEKERREVERQASSEAQNRRKIYQEELRKYYQGKPGYREIVREDGEIDWVAEAEAKRGAELFDEVLEDPEIAKGRMKIRTGGIILMLTLLMGLAVFILYDGKGTIIVESNFPDAQIKIDDFVASAREQQPAGTHVVTVEKEGYTVEGGPITIDLKRGQTDTLRFHLVPAEQEENADPAKDSLKVHAPQP